MCIESQFAVHSTNSDSMASPDPPLDQIIIDYQLCITYYSSGNTYPKHRRAALVGSMCNNFLSAALIFGLFALLVGFGDYSPQSSITWM